VNYPMVLNNDRELIDAFSKYWYNKGQLQLRIGGDDPHGVVTQLDAHYQKNLIQKCPLDLWIYQEILWECKPDLIIEGGTASGASAKFLADTLDRVASEERNNDQYYNPSVSTIDIGNRLGTVPKHQRITYYVGSTLWVGILMDMKRDIDNIESFLGRTPRVMVILDDDHSTGHVYKELKEYWKFVTKGQYLIVEDTNVDHPLGFGDGPGKAVAEFLRNNDCFEVDRTREKFLMTWNPGGYLRRVR